MNVEPFCGSSIPTNRRINQRITKIPNSQLVLITQQGPQEGGGQCCTMPRASPSLDGLKSRVCVMRGRGREWSLRRRACCVLGDGIRRVPRGLMCGLCMYLPCIGSVAPHRVDNIGAAAAAAWCPQALLVVDHTCPVAHPNTHKQRLRVNHSNSTFL